MVALVEQLDPGYDGDLVTGADEVGELFVGEAVEQLEGAYVVEVHQTIAR